MNETEDLSDVKIGNIVQSVLLPRLFENHHMYSTEQMNRFNSRGDGPETSS